jgi:23S rRNA (uridine2552-2'-O)-methyltransferase
MANYKRPDHFTKAAKARGFPARSVFKLEEIDRRARLFRPGMRVLDLGAAPGSWSLYACQKIGDRGLLMAVDLQPLSQVLPKNATFVEGDALALSRDVLAKHAPYDVVISDMAPSTTGDRGTDQARSFRLFDFAVDMAELLGGDGSSFVGKIFMGPDFEAARARLRKLFTEVRVIRPEGVRASSFEVFLVAKGKRREPRAPGEAHDPDQSESG